MLKLLNLYTLNGLSILPPDATWNGQTKIYCTAEVGRDDTAKLFWTEADGLELNELISIHRSLMKEAADPGRKAFRLAFKNGWIDIVRRSDKVNRFTIRIIKEACNSTAGPLTFEAPASAFEGNREAFLRCIKVLEGKVNEEVITAVGESFSVDKGKSEPEYLLGQKVTIIKSGSMHYSATGRIIERFWHYKDGEYKYHVLVAGKVLKGRFTPHELVSSK